MGTCSGDLRCKPGLQGDRVYKKCSGTYIVFKVTGDLAICGLMIYGITKVAWRLEGGKGGV